MYFTVSDRQRVEAAQAAIFSFFLESDDFVKTSGSVGFPGKVSTPCTSAGFL